jgi:tetratricopeptide (TPR) repeat protein
MMMFHAARICLVLLSISLAIAATNEIPAATAGLPREVSDPPVPDNSADAFADYTVGVFLLESGSPQAAIGHLESAWEKSARDETIGRKLAEAYFSVGEFSRCEAVLDDLLSRDENNFDALLLKAKVAYLRSRKEEALHHLERLETEAGPSFEVQRILAKIYSELGRGEQAIEAYGKAIQIDPSYPVIHYQYGMLLQEHGRLAEAEDAFGDAVALRPDFSEAAIQLASILVLDGRPAEAEDVLTRLLEVGPGDYEAVKMITNIYVDTGELDKAIGVLETEYRQSRLPRDGVLLLGRLYYEVDDYDEAFDIFKQLFESGETSSEMARILGEISSRAGRIGDAAVYYRQAIELDPGDYRNHLALFFASSPTFTPDDSLRIEMPDDESARLLTAAASVVSKDDFDGLYLVGISYQSVDSLESAREYLSRAATMQPDDDRVLLSLAGVLEKLGRYEEAEGYLAVLHDMQPDDPTTCNFYGYLLAMMGKDLDKAEDLIEKALEQQPDNGYFIDSLGWVFFMRGDFESAVVKLERASGLAADDPVILEHLGDAYAALERYREALDAYERSFELDEDNAQLREKIGATRERLDE